MVRILETNKVLSEERKNKVVREERKDKVVREVLFGL